MTTESIDVKVPAFEDEIAKEHARKARVLQLLRKCRSVLRKPALPNILEDDDCSEPDLDKVDSVVVIHLRIPDSRANFAPPAQSAMAPAAAEAMAAAEADTAASRPSAVSLTTASPLETATSSIADDTEPSNSSSSVQVAEELTNAPANTTTTTATSSSSSTKNVSKGKELLKSASRRIKAAAASIARGFNEGSRGVANSSAMLALCPVALPANTYTGPYTSYYNPYDGPCSSYALGYHH